MSVANRRIRFLGVQGTVPALVAGVTDCHVATLLAMTCCFGEVMDFYVIPRERSDRGNPFSLVARSATGYVPQKSTGSSTPLRFAQNDKGFRFLRMEVDGGAFWRMEFG